MADTPNVPKQRHGPMRYEYWTRNENEWVAVALYFDRILACSEPAYYVELPDDPGDAGLLFGQEGRDLIARLRLDEDRLSWRYVGDPDIRYKPAPHRIASLRETLGEMRAILANHQTRWGKRSYQMHIETDQANIEDWIESVARYIDDGRTSGREEGRYPLEIGNFVGGLQFLVWLQRMGGSVIIPKVDAQGQPDGVETFGTDEDLTALGIRWFNDQKAHDQRIANTASGEAQTGG